MADPTYELRATFVNSLGTWGEIMSKGWGWGDIYQTQTWLDLYAGAVQDDNVLQFQCNRATGDIFTELTEGTASFIMDNVAGSYSPLLNTKLKPHEYVSFKAYTVNSIYPIFAGWTESFNINPRLEQQTTQITAKDNSYLLKRGVNLGFSENTNPGSLARETFKAADIEEGLFIIDPIDDDIPVSILQSQKAGAALREILKSGGHNIFIDGRGIINFRERGYDIQGTNKATFTELYNYNFSINDDNILNDVRMSGIPRQAATSQQSVAWFEDAPTIAASVTDTYWLDFVEPITNETTVANSIQDPLVSSADYQLNIAFDGSSTDLTSFAVVSATVFTDTIKLDITNISSETAYINKLFVRGYPYTRSPRVTGKTEVSSSQTRYGRKSFEIENDLIVDQNFKHDYSNFLATRYHDPRENISITIKNEFPEILDIGLLSQFIVVHSATGVNSEWSVLGLTHSIDFSAGLEHAVDYDIDKIGDTYGNFFILDHDTRGVLDEDNILSF